MDNNNDLKELVNEDKQHIINFLKHHKIKVKGRVSLLFGDGAVDESTIDQRVFNNLWELQYEPSLVKAEFTIESSRESNMDLQVILKQLILRITTRIWHDNHRDNLNQSKTIQDEFNCYQKINIEKQGVDVRVILISAIGYFN